MNNQGRESSIKNIFAVLALLALLIMMQAAAVYADSVNTDSDEDGSTDGEYSFSGAGDSYGYESYLVYDKETTLFISGRVYVVTIPEDGRLALEVTSEDLDSMTVVIGKENDPGNPVNKWTVTSSNGALALNRTSELLTKGTYDVSFFHDFTEDKTFNSEKKYFYHNLTFRTLNTEEKAAMAVAKKIEGLPDNVVLSDKEKVFAVADEYNALTDVQRGYISDADINKLKSAVESIEEQQKEKDEKPDTQEPDVDPAWEDLIDPDDVIKYQSLKVTPAKAKSFKASKLKKAGKSFKAVTIKGAKGKITFKVSGNRKSKKALKFNKKTKKITVRKGTKKGKYALTIRVHADGGSNYWSA